MFTICTNWFLLPKNGRESLRLVSKMGFTVWNIPSEIVGLTFLMVSGSRKFPLVRLENPFSIYSMDLLYNRISQRCSVNGKQPSWKELRNCLFNMIVKNCHDCQLKLDRIVDWRHFNSLQDIVEFVCLFCNHRHFQETQHTYSLELGTQRVWDYTGGTENYPSIFLLLWLTWRYEFL